MITENQENIIWVDDEPKRVSRLIKRVQPKCKFKIILIERAEKALELISSIPPPKLSIMDLQLGGDEESGLYYGKMIKQIVPSMPILSVTEHLGDFTDEISLALVEDNYPFDYIYEKSKLRSDFEIDQFIADINMIGMTEFHMGDILRMESDYTQVSLRSPDGNEYERYFETEFLKACGIFRPSDNIGVAFQKTIHYFGRFDSNFQFGEVKMFVFKSKERLRDVRKRTMLEEKDFDKIRQKFGSLID